MDLGGNHLAWRAQKSRQIYRFTIGALSKKCGHADCSIYLEMMRCGCSIRQDHTSQNNNRQFQSHAQYAVREREHRKQTFCASNSIKSIASCCCACGLFPIPHFNSFSVLWQTQRLCSKYHSNNNEDVIEVACVTVATLLSQQIVCLPERPQLFLLQP